MWPGRPFWKIPKERRTLLNVPAHRSRRFHAVLNPQCVLKSCTCTRNRATFIFPSWTYMRIYFYRDIGLSDLIFLNGENLRNSLNFLSQIFSVLWGTLLQKVGKLLDTWTGISNFSVLWSWHEGDKSAISSWRLVVCLVALRGRF